MTLLVEYVGNRGNVTCKGTLQTTNSNRNASPPFPKVKSMNILIKSSCSQGESNYLPSRRVNSLTLGLRRTSPAAAACRATAGWDGAALDKLDKLVATLACDRVCGDRGGEGEESDG
jgi:hypothetical protein